MAEAKAVRVVLSHPEKLIREALRSILVTSRDIEVVATVTAARDTIGAICRLLPTVLVWDYERPQQGARNFLAKINRLAPQVYPLLLTSRLDAADLLEAVKAGARGVLFKDCEPSLLVKSVRSVGAGEYWIGRDRIADIMAFFDKARSAEHRDQFGLSRREREIIFEIVSGFTNKEISTALAISDITVKHHLTSIFQKLGVTSRLELAMFALEAGLVRTRSGARR